MFLWCSDDIFQLYFVLMVVGFFLLFFVLLHTDNFRHIGNFIGHVKVEEITIMELKMLQNNHVAITDLKNTLKGGGESCKGRCRRRLLSGCR